MATSTNPVLDKSSDTDLYKSSITSSIEDKKTWEEIEEILRKMNESASHTDKYDSENENMTRLFDTIAKMKHNNSGKISLSYNFLDYKINVFSTINI